MKKTLMLFFRMRWLLFFIISICLFSIIFHEDYTSPFVKIFLLACVLAAYIIDRLLNYIMLDKNERKRVKEVNRLYNNKANRYKNVYGYFYHLYFDKDENCSNKCYVRNLVSIYEANKASIKIPISGLFATILMVFIDKVNEMYAMVIKSLLPLIEYVGKSFGYELTDDIYLINQTIESIADNTGMTVILISIIIIVVSMLNTMANVQKQAYINKVIKDIAADIEYFEQDRIVKTSNFRIYPCDAFKQSVMAEDEKK